MQMHANTPSPTHSMLELTILNRDEENKPIKSKITSQYGNIQHTYIKSHVNEIKLDVLQLLSLSCPYYNWLQFYFTKDYYFCLNQS